ncbi:hypothetical protein D3C71_1386430 [compost metagenome]
MGSQQGTGQAQHRQVAQGEGVEQARALEPGDEAQGDEGEGGAAEGDDAGVGLDQVTEDTGQAEQHSGDMGNAQGVTVAGGSTGYGD